MIERPKMSMIKRLSLMSDSSKVKLNSYIYTINSFISVSKLVLNRFVAYL
jgi:hypothetical protein